MEFPPNAREIGECIYCGDREDPLIKEHAVPLGLNGNMVLLKASCKKCAEITHKIEREVMRSLWPDVRNVLAMRSRRKEKRSPTLPLVVVRNGAKETLQIPRSEYPTYLSTPLFPLPAKNWIREPVRGVFTNLGLIHLAGPTFKQASERFPGAEFVGAHTNFSAEFFARTLAKIGYCAAISALGLEALRNSMIKGIILGTDPQIGHWVGSWQGEPVTETGRGLHAIQVRCSVGRIPEIHVFVRLFAQFDAPEYHIMLGEANPAIVNSNEWPWPTTGA